MILQALVQLAENEKLIADPDFEFKPVSWAVRLNLDGEVLVIEDYRRDLYAGKIDKKGRPIKPKWVGQDVLIPTVPTGKSGTAPAAAFLVENSRYLFAVQPGAEPDRSKFLPYVERFRKLVAACEAATGDPSVGSVVRMLDRTLAGRDEVALPADAAASDLFMFRVGNDDSPVHARPSVWAWWKTQRVPPAAPTDAENARPPVCLVTGQPVFGQPALFPLIKRLPGGSVMGVGLVSFNAPAWESYGWDNMENATISRAAAEAGAIALNRLLDLSPTDGKGQTLPVRRVRLAEDTTVVFWSPKISPEVKNVLDLIPDLMNPTDDVKDVGNLYAAVRNGSMRPLSEPAAFYAMTITGTTGRAVVRDWFEETVEALQANLTRHFEALSCVRNTPPTKGVAPRPFLTLVELMNSLAAPGRERKVPAALAGEFFHAALRGTPYPSAILQRALLRERAEVTADDWDSHVRRDARAALIKAVLTRDPVYKTHLEESMDENRSEPGYLLGRLMAVLEDTQRLASGGVNASVKDKFYGAASATPAAVFPTMMDLFHKHCRKARDTKPGAVINREKLADIILAKLSSIPVHLDLKEQGLFVLGYHHQRHELFKKPATEADSSAPAMEGATA